ncbi:hypothetical protein RFI_17012, partial [Reticulomyxa filosa]
NESKGEHAWNEWIDLTDSNNKKIVISKDEHSYKGVRAVIGGKDDNLLFISRFPKNMDVFDLSKMEFVTTIMNERLPMKPHEYGLGYHCLVKRPIEGQCDIMVLFCLQTGLCIRFDEQTQTFTYKQLNVCNDIAPLKYYAFECIDGHILFFGGCNLATKKKTDAIHCYSIANDTWTKSRHTLPSPFCGGVAVLSPPDHSSIHILGGMNDDHRPMAIHFKTPLQCWTALPLKIDKEERKQEQLSLSNSNSNSNSNSDVQGRSKWILWWNQMQSCERELVLERFHKLTRQCFEKWLVDDSQWKSSIKHDDVVWITFAIEAYLLFNSKDS